MYHVAYIFTTINKYVASFAMLRWKCLNSDRSMENVHNSVITINIPDMFEKTRMNRMVAIMLSACS